MKRIMFLKDFKRKCKNRIVYFLAPLWFVAAFMAVAIVMFSSRPAAAFPPAGYDDFDSRMELTFILTGFGTFTETFTGPTKVERGDPYDSGGGIMQIDTEIISMELHGRIPGLGTITVRESRTRRSTGNITEQTAGSDFPADSFFDVFVEIETPLGTFHNEVPSQLVANNIGALPPCDVEYWHENEVDLLNEDGDKVGFIPEDLSNHTPCQDPSFSVAPGGPSGLDQADIFDRLTSPVPQIPKANLGLVAGDDLDGLSYGFDYIDLHMDLRFSVDPSAVGVVGTAVNIEAAKGPNEAHGDEFMAFPPPVSFWGLGGGSNIQVLDENGIIVPPAPPMFYQGSPSLKLQISDDVDALTDEPTPFVDNSPRDQVPDPGRPVYFSLAQSSPTLLTILPAGASPADILVSVAGGAPTVYIEESDLGLTTNDDIDAFCLDVTTNTVLFSLTPTSPSLGGASPSTLFQPGAKFCSVAGTPCVLDGDCPATETCDATLVPVVLPFQLGLLPTDNLNALKCLKYIELKPPVRQDIGFFDGYFNTVVEAECRNCHGPTPLGRCSITDATCTVDADCTAKFCSVAGTPCVVDGDCPATETCDASQTCDVLPVDPTYLPDRHHLNVDTPVPVGTCEETPNSCDVDSDCNVCSVTTATTCTTDGDCPATETCTTGENYCVGESQRPYPSGDTAGHYDCFSCHDLVWNPVTFTFDMVVFRDCAFCHDLEFQPDHPDRAQEPNVHHRTAEATGGDCVHCHGNVVDGLTDGHTIPTYQPSLVTPWPSGKNFGRCSVSDTQCVTDANCPATEECDLGLDGGGGGGTNARGTEQGNCNYCHDSTSTDTCDVGGTDKCVIASTVDCTIDADCNGSLLINHDTHHFTGLPGVVINPAGDEACLWCHQPLFPGAHIGFPKNDAFDIRVCENCHGISSLHNIQGDSLATPGVIVPGHENPCYGHIGSNTECNGCHGFTAAGAVAPESGPIIPFITSADDLTMTAGTDTTVALTGVAFTNIVTPPVGDPIELTSTVELTAADGSVTALNPDSVTGFEIVVTLPGSLSEGTYDLRAVKGPKVSNPVVVAVTADVTITDVRCSRKKGILTIDGSGFGSKPAGTDDYISVEINGQSVDIISWSDTRITASVSRCPKNASTTVNALYGSDSSGGGGKPDKPCKGKKCKR